MLEILMNNLLFVSVGWMLLTFLVETVLVAGNGWKVSGKTPIYLRVWEMSSSPSFCTVLWSTLCIYFIMTFCGYVLIGGSVSWGFLLIASVPPMGVFIPEMILSFMLLVAAGTFCVAFLIAFIAVKFRESESKVFKENALTNGAKEWYTQIKDKYCPVLTKED